MDSSETAAITPAATSALLNVINAVAGPVLMLPLIDLVILVVAGLVVEQMLEQEMVPARLVLQAVDKVCYYINQSLI